MGTLSLSLKKKSCILELYSVRTDLLKFLVFQFVPDQSYDVEFIWARLWRGIPSTQACERNSNRAIWRSGTCPNTCFPDARQKMLQKLGKNPEIRGLEPAASGFEYCSLNRQAKRRSYHLMQCLRYRIRQHRITVRIRPLGQIFSTQKCIRHHAKVYSSSRKSIYIRYPASTSTINLLLRTVQLSWTNLEHVPTPFILLE